MSEPLRFLDFELHPAESRLLKGGAEIPLQPKVLDALLLFARNPGQLLSKERLMSELWPDVIVGEEALTQVIRKLRQALEDDPREPRCIQTVMKRGYRFLPELIDDPPAEGKKATVAPQVGARSGGRPLPTPAPRSGRHGISPSVRLAVGLIGALVAIAGVVGWLSRGDPARTGGSWSLSRLTAQPEREQEGVFSPDGRSYAFVANLDGQFDLHLAAFAGGRRIRLTETPDHDEYYPQFSSDGATLYFTREPLGGGAPAVWSIPAFGGDERLLVADASYGAASPDGARLAYARFLRDGRFALRLHDLETNAERELATADEWLGSITWAPDGGELAFVTPSSVRVVDLASGQSRTIRQEVESVRTVAWEPGSGALVHDGAITGSNARIWRVVPSDGTVEAIGEAPNAAWHPAFDREGRRMLLTVEHKTRQLWRVGADGSGLISLPLPTTAECFDVDAEGRQLVVNDWEPAPGADSIELVDLATGATRGLGDGLCPSLSTDGRKVAFLAGRDDTVDLVVSELATGQETIVSRDLGRPGFVESNLDRRPIWSPRGDRLVVERMRASGWDLVAVELATSAERSLIAGEVEAGAFSPDGARYAFCGATPLGSGLHWIDLATGRARRISDSCSYRSAPVWTEDGRALRILIGERRDPRLVSVDLEGRPLPDLLRLERPADPAFWGIFELRALAGGGWILLSERYEGDLFLLEQEAN